MKKKTNPKARERWQRWLARWRAYITHALGGKCTNCGRSDQLEFDHITPSTVDLHALNQSQRRHHYEEELCRGNLQLLCRSCNASKGARPELQKPLAAAEVMPF